MSKEKQNHTPGPWTHDEAQDFRICVFTEGPEDPICDVRCHDGSSSGEHGEANARLIAAAPELLSALHIAKHYADCHDLATADEKVREDLEVINAAIAKAEGK